MSRNNTNMSKKNNSKSRKPAPTKSQKQVRQFKVETAPVSIGNRTNVTRPRFQRKPGRSENEIITHSEYISDITGSSSLFKISKTIALNPGLASSFPWLSNIANRYESYKFRKCNFRFMTERPTTEPGFVAIIPDYDPQDQSPTTKTTAFQYQSASKCAPWENMVQYNTPSNLAKRKEFFTRGAPLPAAQAGSIGLYDTANVFICVGGNSSDTVVLGELWCDYEVELMTPQISTDLVSGDSVRIINENATSTPALPFGVNPDLQQTGLGGTSSIAPQDPLVLYDSSNGRITFQKPYQGVVVIDTLGTTVTSVPVTGTATFSAPTTVINAAATNAMTRFILTAAPGQYIDPAVTSVAVSEFRLRMGAYAASLS